MEKLLIFLVIFAVSKIVEMVNSAKAARQASAPEPLLTSADTMPPTTGSPAVPTGNSGRPLREHRERSSSRRSNSEPATAGRKTRSSRSTSTGGRSRTDSTRTLGAGVQKHVESYIIDHVRQHLDSQVDDSVRRNITQHVQQHLGTGLSADAEQSTAPQSVQDIRGMLHNLNDVRKAVLLNEILTRPRCLTRPR